MPDRTLKKIFTPEIVEFLKNNKSEITTELLEELRSSGNPGKHLALEILDFPKDAEQYYLDSFGNRITFNGNRRLKKQFTKLDLSPIHIEELTRCSEDIHYFKDNYVKIRTKSGVNFPEVRSYQNDFISLLNSDEEGIVGLMGRQSSKSISTSIYLNHLIIFDKEKNIGIVANKGSLAREFLANVKNIFMELPIWMQIGCKAWNKSFVEFENEMRCLTDVPSQDSFRGFSIHCLDGKSEVEVYDKIEKCYKTISLEDLYDSKKENLLIKTQSGYKDFDGIRRTENTGLVIKTEKSEIRCTEDHRILVGKCNSGKIYRKAKNLNACNKINKDIVINIEIDKNKKYYYDPINVRDGNNYISDNITHHNCAVIDETAFIRPSIFSEFIDAFLPSQAALSWKKNIILSTPKGQNHFFDIVKGASLKYAEDGSGIKEKGSTGYSLFKVDWRDVPRYDKDGNQIKPEIFKGNIIKKHGLIYWNQNFACVSGDTIITLYDKVLEEIKKIKMHEADKLLVKNKNNDRYLIETKNGYEDFDNIISRGVKPTLKIKTENEEIIVTSNHRFVVLNNEVIASKLKIGDYLETKNGLEYIINIKYNEEIEVFDVLNTESHTYFANNINNHNCEFIGSSHTLVDASALEKFISKEPEEIRDGKLKIYKKPEKGHQYICSVDSAKDGIDDFAVNIIDITDFKFEQVATAQLQIDYLLMPEYINDWCEYYNNPYLIIENVDGSGQSIADQMYQTYEYENLHFDKDSGTKKKKKYPGFRTTTKSRKLILQTLKLFIENNNLIIHDKKTINQFYTFILLNNKYQADENCKDDAVMALAIAFAPFCNSKNFEDMKELIDRLYNTFDESEDDESKNKNFSDFLTIGSFDDSPDIEDLTAGRSGSNNYNNLSYIVEPDGFY